VVDKSQKRESCDQGVRIEEDKDSTSGLSLGDSVCVADTSAKEGNSVVEKVSVVKARDEQAVSVVMNYKSSKEVINNSKGVFSAFDDNEDKDYRESNKDKDAVNENKGGLGVGEIDKSDDKEGLSEINISKSDNKECTKAGNNSGRVSAVKGDKNIGRRESCQEAKNNKSSNRSKSVTDDNKI
jgi:hypothetical protein